MLELGNSNSLVNSLVTNNVAGAWSFPRAGRVTTSAAAGGGNIALTALGGGSLTLNVSGTSNTAYSGQLSGSGNLAIGGGTLDLTGSNTFTGTTAVNGGVLVAGNTGALANWGTAGYISVASGAAFAVQGGTAGGEFSLAQVGTALSKVSFASSTASFGIQVMDAAPFVLTGTTLSGAQGLEVLGTGTLVSTAANTYTGPTTIAGGATFQLGNGSLAGSIASTSLVDNGTLVVSSTAAQTLAAAISGVGNLTKTGTGTLTLSGSNYFTGATTITTGVLTLSNSNALQGSTVAVNVANGLTFAMPGTYSVGGLSGNSAFVLNGGCGRDPQRQRQQHRLYQLHRLHERFRRPGPQQRHVGIGLEQLLHRHDGRQWRHAADKLRRGRRQRHDQLQPRH